MNDEEIQEIREIVKQFKEKETFCKQHGDPIQLIVEKLNEHTKAINALDSHLQKLLLLEDKPSDAQIV